MVRLLLRAERLWQPVILWVRIWSWLGGWICGSASRLDVTVCICFVVLRARDLVEKSTYSLVAWKKPLFESSTEPPSVSSVSSVSLVSPIVR